MNRIVSIRNWNTVAVVLGFLIASLSVIGCGQPQPEVSVDGVVDEIPFRVDGRLQIIRGDEIIKELEIEIAAEDSSRIRGMMQRTVLPDDRGMLFVFETEEDRAFWMANTPLSLDLIFIDSDSTIMNMAKYMRPLSAQDVPSDGPAQYVLELIAGSADTIGLIEGDRVRWETDTSR